MPKLRRSPHFEVNALKIYTEPSQPEVFDTMKLTNDLASYLILNNDNFLLEPFRKILKEYNEYYKCATFTYSISLTNRIVDFRSTTCFFSPETLLQNFFDLPFRTESEIEEKDTKNDSFLQNYREKIVSKLRILVALFP